MTYINELEEKILAENGAKIGEYQIWVYYEGYEKHDPDDEIEKENPAAIEFAYVGSIYIKLKYRCQGYGGRVLQELAKKYGKLYICPENARCKHLYERLGEAVPYYLIPEVLHGNADCAYIGDEDDDDYDEDFSGVYVIEG